MPHAQLRLVGTGPELPTLKKFVQDHHMNNVQFYNFVSPQEKNELLQTSWVFVTPSSLEGWGITVIEANACNLPAIAFDVPGLRESIQHNRTGYLARDQAEMQAMILTLLKDSKLRHALGKNAHQWSTNFTWKKTAQKTMKILQELHHEHAKG